METANGQNTGSRVWLLGIACGSLVSCVGCADRSAIGILREVGRRCCDARTYEAVGMLSVPADNADGAETLHFRWVFGPNGEYRFERGDAVVVHDTYRIAGTRSSTPERSGMDARYQPRSGPHHRWPGDMVMATGMVADAMTYPTAAMRLAGREWIQGICDPVRVGFASSDDANPRDECVIRVVDENGASIEFRIDRETYRLLGWEMGRLKVAFDEVRINPVLTPSEFKIPD